MKALLRTLFISGFAEHAAPSEFDPQSSRRFDPIHALWIISHGDRIKTSLFGRTLVQTYGLMAFGSNRGQKKNIDFSCFEFLQTLRHVFRDQGHNWLAWNLTRQHDVQLAELMGNEQL